MSQIPLSPEVAHNFSPLPGHDHPGVYFSSYFSYFDKYDTFPVWPRNILHSQCPLILYHARNYKYGIWILKVSLNQDF